MEPLGVFLQGAWRNVKPTRRQMIVAIADLSEGALEDAGLYGPELSLKLGLWLTSRTELAEQLDDGHELDEPVFDEESAAADLPEGVTPEGERLPAKKPKRKKSVIQKVLGAFSKVLGHADNWLESLIQALGQNERLKELKKCLEKSAGDAAGFMGNNEGLEV